MRSRWLGSQLAASLSFIRWLPNHLDRAERLGPHLGPTLVQLPPRWKRNVERLDEFLTAAPKHVRWAVELREQSWVHDDVFACLERHGAAFCVHDLLEGCPWVRTTDWAYVRFHGPNAQVAKYWGLYGGRRLWRPAERMEAWLDEGCDVYAYFNNDWHGFAVQDARWLADRLRCRDAVVADARGHRQRRRPAG